MKINKEKLRELYNSKPNRIVCEKLGISCPTLISLLNRCGIALKGKGNRNPKSKVMVY